MTLVLLAGCDENGETLEAEVHLAGIPRRGEQVELDHDTGTTYARVADVTYPTVGQPMVTVSLWRPDGVSDDDWRRAFAPDDDTVMPERANVGLREELKGAIEDVKAGDEIVTIMITPAVTLSVRRLAEILASADGWGDGGIGQGLAARMQSVAPDHDWSALVADAHRRYCG